MEKAIDVKPCPFCGSISISVYEDSQEKGILQGSNFVYAFCESCSARGPHIYTVDLKTDEQKEKLGLEHWNVRNK